MKIPILGIEITKVKKSTKEKGMRFLKKSLIYSQAIILTYTGIYLFLCYINNTIPDGVLTEKIFDLFCVDSVGKSLIKVAEIIGEFMSKKGSTE